MTAQAATLALTADRQVVYRDLNNMKEVTFGTKADPGDWRAGRSGFTWRFEMVDGTVRDMGSCAQMYCGLEPAMSGTMVHSETVAGYELEASKSIVVKMSAAKIDCENTVVDRGDPIDCSVKPDPEEATLSNIRWSFRADDQTDRSGNVFEIAGDSSASWGGRMVVSGWMRVKANLTMPTPGRPYITATSSPPMDSVHIVVQARKSWATLPFQEGPDIIMPRESLDAELSDSPAIFFGFHTGLYSVDPSSDDSVTSGPNKGLKFFTRPPYVLRHRIQINTNALRMESQFWYHQPAQPGPSEPPYTKPYCGRDAVLNQLLPAVEQHEGKVPGQISHRTLWSDEFNRVAHQRWTVFEGAVDMVDPARLLGTVGSDADHAARTRSLRLDNDPPGTGDAALVEQDAFAQLLASCSFIL